ncbi:hypothetical protein D3C77_745320 [compost metagenome]
MEFIHHDVFPGALKRLVEDVLVGFVDHVIKVHFSLRLERGCISLTNRREEGKRCTGLPWIGRASDQIDEFLIAEVGGPE